MRTKREQYLFSDWESQKPLPKGWDAADAVDDGWTADEIKFFMRATMRPCTLGVAPTQHTAPRSRQPAQDAPQPPLRPQDGNHEVQDPRGGEDCPPPLPALDDGYFASVERDLAEQGALYHEPDCGLNVVPLRPRDATISAEPPTSVTTVVRDRDGTSALSEPGREKRSLVENGKGKVVWCVENACLTMEYHSDWRGALAYNEFAGVTMLLRPIPGTTVPVSSFEPRPLVETDITAAVRWFNRNRYPDATKQATADALYAVAAQTIISPVRHYLEGVAWDGVPRVGFWLAIYCGAADTPLTSQIGRAWMVSAVARALKPGCKVDCALILEGKQGAGKSSAFKVLAGEEWFSDSLPDMHSKDASGGLLGKWIIELGELAAMRRSDVEAVKSFISRTTERYRPPYGRCEVIQHRRCVFGGTTNRSDYLADDTGNRRFWPVQVGHIDLDSIKRDRDQLWAEAVALYRAGVKWWLDADGEVAAAEMVKTRVADDPWEATVLNAVSGSRQTSTSEIFEKMSILEKDRTKADQMRITGVLTRAGWTNDGRFSSGPSRGLTRYLAPRPAEPAEGDN